MAPQKRNKAIPNDDPIMWEVDDDENKSTKVERRSKKKVDKGDELMNQFTQKDNDDCCGKKDSGMTREEQKAFNKFHYGEIDSDNDDGETEMNAAAGMRKRSKKDKGGLFGGIKPTHLLLMFLMVGSAFIPMIIMGAEVVAPYVSQVLPDFTPMMVNLGLAATPKRRLVSFYEKHNPDKMEEVDKILLKYAGDYGKMVKKLESKYHDYGYFLKWEEDGSVAELQKKTYEYMQVTGAKYYTKYVPYPLRRGLLNIYTNVLTITKKIYKQLDKWTNPKMNVPKGAKSGAGNTRKSRRERNFENRDN
mmetsp:Transcript_10481/g.12752  ORF Transcript_10481/g.12752 Transcript_10481/m.12752 type:complete len:304 (+) Transcript_10481:20-931(+)